MSAPEFGSTNAPRVGDMLYWYDGSPGQESGPVVGFVTGVGDGWLLNLALLAPGATSLIHRTGVRYGGDDRKRIELAGEGFWRFPHESAARRIEADEVRLRFNRPRSPHVERQEPAAAV